MQALQAITLGLLQGVTELFPISSLGHSVLLPPLLHSQLDESAPSFLIFLVATHAATALVLFAFYFSDWMKIAGGMLHSLRTRRILEENTYGKIGWLLVVSTVPAGILGILFEKSIQGFFATPLYVALFLVGNGALLFGAERLRRSRTSVGAAVDKRIASLSWNQAIGIGCMQCLALFPGFSRTGASLAGGLLSGFSHEEAMRYAFLLATPIIAAAAVLKLPELWGSEMGSLGIVLLGTVCAALGAYVSVRFLTHYFKTRTLVPFAVYCTFAGLVSLVLMR